MRKGIERFQLLTHDIEGYSHEQQVLDACMAGARWIQLRTKKLAHEDFLAAAREAKRMCVIFNAVLIINDNAEIARAVNADGVHLGKDDMPIKLARKLLGSGAIIGTSCNTFGEIEIAAKEQADYTGVGPYRYTPTRKNLNPLLGLDGIRDVMRQYHIQSYKLPVIAIGGVRLEDVPFLMQTGVHGVAVSSAVHNAEDKKEAVRQFLTIVKESHAKIVA